MTRIAPLLAVVLASSLARCAAAQASILCAWTKVTSDAEVHYTFLRQAASSARLYHSVWSGERTHLLGCSWSDDMAVIHDYFSLCQERAHEFSDHPDQRLDLDSMFDAENACVSLASPVSALTKQRAVGGPRGRGERSEVKTHERVKRGFIVPGTLWCGSGNKAPSYGDLGFFSDTDSCCREHDQCRHTILSFHSGFGVFNSNIFTMSHCSCDNKFRSCLQASNDSISGAVGYTFFNLLKMHCFELSHRLQCTKRNWFGMCKESQMALYADVYPPALFESEPVKISVNSTSFIINATTPTVVPQRTTSGPHLFTISAAASTVHTASPSARSTSLTSSLSTSVAPVTTVTASRTSIHTPRGSEPESRENLDTLNQTLPDRPDTADGLLICGIYKELDDCRNKILPQQKRYGLHNSDHRTLYHCNCTSRFFQTLGKQRQLSEVQSLLLGHVSQSCFVPQACTSDNICAALVVQQHHLQAVRVEVRRPKTRRIKRKDRVVQLHKMCLRMLRSKLKKTTKQKRGRLLV